VSLEQKAEQAMEILVQFDSKIKLMASLCHKVLFKKAAVNETLQFSKTAKQKLIAEYQTVKIELKALVDELP